MQETNFIISLTTLPPRFKHLKMVLDSLCEQAYDNYEVHLNVPKETKFDGEYKEDLSKYDYGDKLKIFYVEDVGAVTKLYYTLKRTKNGEQRIITVDDDFIYDKYMLSEYNLYIQDNPKISEGVIGFAGVYPLHNSGPTDGTLDCIGALKEPQRVGITEGYKSVCYKRSHFSKDFFENGYKYHYNDDLAVFAWLGLNGVEKWCIPYRFESSYQNRVLSFPLVHELSYPKSGINHQRDDEGGSQVSYKKFYNTEIGKGIQV
tara:strand:- start:5781 stop:6560 length:780 start_codon:yes stop_codon:yes gene_type:complete